MQPNMVKWQEFQVHNKSRQIAQLDTMIDEFEQMIIMLEQQIAAQASKADTDFTTSTMIRAIRQRRDNLVTSVDNLKKQRANIKTELIELEMHSTQILAGHKRYRSSAGQVVV